MAICSLYKMKLAF